LQFDAQQLREAAIYFIVVEFEALHDKFPVLKGIHEKIKVDIKKTPKYVKFLRSQPHFWQTHAGNYVTPQDGGWKKLLAEYNHKKEEETLKCIQ